MQQQTIIFMGLQGSGKGTQVKLLKERIEKGSPDSRILYFDAGAHFRAFFAEGGYTQKMVEESVARGELQPDFLSSFLLSRAFITEVAGGEHMLIDGFPRSLVQAEILHGALTFYKRENLTVIFLNVGEEEAMKRLLLRGRHDDTEEGIRERFRWYKDIVVKTLDFYRAHSDYRVLEINGEQTPEEVHEDVVRALSL